MSVVRPNPRAKMPAHLVPLILAAFALTLVLAAPASASTARPDPNTHGAVDGSIGLRLVDVPTGARDDPRARLYVFDHLLPRTVIHRRIDVSNTTASTVH